MEAGTESQAGRGSTAPPAPDAPPGRFTHPSGLSQKPRSRHPGRPPFSSPGGTGHGGPLPSTDDVGSVTGGLQPCSGPAGPGGVPCSPGAFFVNPFLLTFLDSGGLLKFVCRFSGGAFRQGAWGVVVKADEHDSLISDVDHVPAPFRAPNPVSSDLGPPHRAGLPVPPAEAMFRLLLEQCPSGRGRGPDLSVLHPCQSVLHCGPPRP